MPYASQAFSALVSKITGDICAVGQRLVDLVEEAVADHKRPHRLRKEVTAKILIIATRGLQQDAAGIRCDQRMVSGGKLGLGFQYIFPAMG
jgi:hypothetical protein